MLSRCHVDHGFTLRVERDGSDGRPIAGVAGPARRVALSGLAVRISGRNRQAETSRLGALRARHATAGGMPRAGTLWQFRFSKGNSTIDREERYGRPARRHRHQLLVLCGRNRRPDNGGELLRDHRESGRGGSGTRNMGLDGGRPRFARRHAPSQPGLTLAVLRIGNPATHPDFCHVSRRWHAPKPCALAVSSRGRRGRHPMPGPPAISGRIAS